MSHKPHTWESSWLEAPHSAWAHFLQYKQVCIVLVNIVNVMSTELQSCTANMSLFAMVAAAILLLVGVQILRPSCLFHPPHHHHALPRPHLKYASRPLLLLCICDICAYVVRAMLPPFLQGNSHFLLSETTSNSCL